MAAPSAPSRRKRGFCREVIVVAQLGLARGLADASDQREAIRPKGGILPDRVRGWHVPLVLAVRVGLAVAVHARISVARLHRAGRRGRRWRGRRRGRRWGGRGCGRWRGWRRRGRWRGRRRGRRRRRWRWRWRPECPRAAVGAVGALLARRAQRSPRDISPHIPAVLAYAVVGIHAQPAARVVTAARRQRRRRGRRQEVARPTVCAVVPAPAAIAKGTRPTVLADAIG